jgi:hypothetical protein
VEPEPDQFDCATAPAGFINAPATVNTSNILAASIAISSFVESSSSASAHFDCEAHGRPAFYANKPKIT